MTHFFRRHARALASTKFPAQSSEAGAPPASPRQVFERYVEAANAGDMPAIGALISGQVERSDYVRCEPTMGNKECLLAYIRETVVGVGGQIKTLQLEVKGDTAHGRIEVSSSTARGFGLARIVGTDVVQVRDGLITAFRFVPEFADEQTATFFGKLGIGPRASNPVAKPAAQP